MISPAHMLVGKAGFKAAVIATALEVAAYGISPETFSLVAVGVGALVVAFVAIITMILTNSGNRKNRELMAQIAKDQEASTGHMQTLEVRMDGRMDKMLGDVAQISEAVGVRKGLQQAANIAAAQADNTAARDAGIIDKVSDAVVNRVTDAIDKAAERAVTKENGHGTKTEA